MRLKLLKPGLLVAAGGALAHLLDPDRGKARRAKLRDQTLAKARRLTAQAEKRAQYVEGRLEGVVAKSAGAGAFSPESDVDLREHLRQVIASQEFDTIDVNVDVADSVATLRGQLRTPELIKKLQADIAEVPGVARVESFLHLPNTPAPNKAAAISAS